MEVDIKGRIAASQSAVVQDIGRRIKDGRVAKEMSQALLANKLGLTRAAVTQWETGQATCNYAQALELEKLLGIDVCFLIFGRAGEDEDISGTKTDLAEDAVASAA